MSVRKMKPKSSFAKFLAVVVGMAGMMLAFPAPANAGFLCNTIGKCGTISVSGGNRPVLVACNWSYRVDDVLVYSGQVSYNKFTSRGARCTDADGYWVPPTGTLCRWVYATHGIAECVKQSAGWHKISDNERSVTLRSSS